jgi:hypothetical protein
MSGLGAVGYVATVLAMSAQAASPPAFEAVSIKPSSPKERQIGMLVYDGGRITVTNFTLKMLIHGAYPAMQMFQIVGGRSGSIMTYTASLPCRPPIRSRVSITQRIESCRRRRKS